MHAYIHKDCYTCAGMSSVWEMRMWAATACEQGSCILMLYLGRCVSKGPVVYLRFVCE